MEKSSLLCLMIIPGRSSFAFITVVSPASGIGRLAREEAYGVQSQIKPEEDMLTSTASLRQLLRVRLIAQETAATRKAHGPAFAGLRGRPAAFMEHRGSLPASSMKRR